MLVLALVLTFSMDDALGGTNPELNVTNDSTVGSDVRFLSSGCAGNLDPIELRVVQIAPCQTFEATIDINACGSLPKYAIVPENTNANKFIVNLELPVGLAGKVQAKFWEQNIEPQPENYLAEVLAGYQLDIWNRNHAPNSARVVCTDFDIAVGNKCSLQVAGQDPVTMQYGAGYFLRISPVNSGEVSSEKVSVVITDAGCPPAYLNYVPSNFGPNPYEMDWAMLNNSPTVTTIRAPYPCSCEASPNPVYAQVIDSVYHDAVLPEYAQLHMFSATFWGDSSYRVGFDPQIDGQVLFYSAADPADYSTYSMVANHPFLAAETQTNVDLTGIGDCRNLIMFIAHDPCAVMEINAGVASQD
jgi:hypothetical protein